MYIISDTHFGHTNMLLHEPERLQKASMEGYGNFDRFLIERLNGCISKNDEVLHLGDVAFEEGYKLAKKLNGKITLIKGNHDKDRHIEYYKSIGWKAIGDIRIDIDFDKSHIGFLKYKYDRKTLSKTACLVKEVNSKKILFSHYPVFNDNPYDEKYKNVSALLQEVFNICGCDLNIHGHTHSYTVSDKRCINACLEVNDFKPLDLKEIFDG